MDLIASRIAAGHVVELSGFGTFSTSERGARHSRDPRTGETIQMTAMTAPNFSAASRLKSAVKGG